MEPKRCTQKLYHSKLLIIGTFFLIIAVTGSALRNWLFSDDFPVFAFPLQFIFLIAPYIAIPLLSTALLVYLAKELMATKKPTLKLIYALSIILTLLAAFSLHLMITGTIGIPLKISSYETLAWSPLTILFLMIALLASMVPIVFIVFLIKCIKRLVNPPDSTLRTRYMLLAILMSLVTIPLIVAVYGFVLPVILFFMSLSGLSSW